jgi:hypothetical protein
MARVISIPGRRISSAEEFYTDWLPRGGDCVLLRVEVLIDQGNGELVVFELETRGEDGTTVSTITPTSPSAGLSLSATGVASCLYLASTSGTAGNGAQEEVRVKVWMTEEGSGYYVVRIFPLIFFDSAREY